MVRMKFTSVQDEAVSLLGDLRDYTKEPPPHPFLEGCNFAVQMTFPMEKVGDFHWWVVRRELTRQDKGADSSTRQANHNFKKALALALEPELAPYYNGKLSKKARGRQIERIAEDLMILFKAFGYDLHHIVPREYGGRDDANNLVLMPSTLHRVYNEETARALRDAPKEGPHNLLLFFSIYPIMGVHNFFDEMVMDGNPQFGACVKRAFERLAAERAKHPLAAPAPAVVRSDVMRQPYGRPAAEVRPRL